MGKSFADQQGSEQVVAPVVIEATAISEGDSSAQAAVTQVPVGVGAKSIDAPVNEFGIEQKNMQGAQDLSLERRAENWWLNPRVNRQEWSKQAHGDFSGDQRLRLKTSGNLSGLQSSIEGGVAQDHRSVPYLDNQGNPYQSTQNTVKSYSNRRDSGYGKIVVAGDSWKTLADLDTRFEDIHAGPTLTGTQNARQASLNGQFKTAIGDLTPYGQYRSSEFASSLSPLASNQSQGTKFGIQTESKPIAPWMIQTSFSREALGRKFADTTALDFNRNSGKVLSQVSLLTHPWVEVALHGFTEMALDRITGKSDTSAVWDAGMDVSSSHRFDLGIEGKIRRYSLMPTPLQKFGDGALLQGSSALPAETGMRYSIGPWYTHEHEGKMTEFAVSFFAEHSVNSPIMVAVSPTAARTLPLGGVWSRGAELKGSVQFWKLTFSPSYTLQDAVNDSSVNWQRGQAIPGRPAWTLRSEAKYEDHGMKFGMVHRYQSEDAIDLSGLWSRPAFHQVDAFVGYGQKNWELRLVANNLLPSNNLPETSTFQGTAAPNLLEPMIQQTEVRLQCEFLI